MALSLYFIIMCVQRGVPQHFKVRNRHRIDLIVCGGACSHTLITHTHTHTNDRVCYARMFFCACTFTAVPPISPRHPLPLTHRHWTGSAASMASPNGFSINARSQHTLQQKAKRTCTRAPTNQCSNVCTINIITCAICCLHYRHTRARVCVCVCVTH